MPCSEMCDVLSYSQQFLPTSIMLRFSVKYLVYTCMQVIFIIDDLPFSFCLCTCWWLVLCMLDAFTTTSFCSRHHTLFVSYLTTFSFLSIILFYLLFLDQNMITHQSNIYLYNYSYTYICTAVMALRFSRSIVHTVKYPYSTGAGNLFDILEESCYWCHVCCSAKSISCKKKANHGGFVV